MSKLLILRGPSGSGKSSVARELQKTSTHKIAWIEQDYYKEVMFIDRESSIAARHEMVINDVLIALRHNFDVLLDGIFSVPSHTGTFEKLFAEHPDENYVFFFDISLEETLRRHQTRQQKDLFGEEDMRSWYALGGPLGHAGEVIIPESSTFIETVKCIGEKAGI